MSDIFFFFFFFFLQQNGHSKPTAWLDGSAQIDNTSSPPNTKPNK